MFGPFISAISGRITVTYTGKYTELEASHPQLKFKIHKLTERSGKEKNISPLPRFEPQTVQPVAQSL
jgi:hypothetical protein